MSLVRYQPWNSMDQFRREMRQMLEGQSSSEEGSSIATSDWVPAVDIKETEKEFLLYADIPGVILMISMCIWKMEC